MFSLCVVGHFACLETLLPFSVNIIKDKAGCVYSKSQSYG